MRSFFTRITLFIATNLAVLMLLSVVMRVLGLDQAMYARGVPSGSLLVMAAVVGFGGAFISLALSKIIAKWTTRAVVIKNPQTEVETWLLATVNEQARRVGLRTPEVAIYPSPDMNAFATGMFRNSALVAVSEGLLRSMNRREIEAVLAHEVSHIANGDMITMTLLQGVLNTFVIFLSRVVGYFVDRVLLKNERGRGIGYWATVFAAELMLGILASFIVMWFSRRREFRADAGAAELVGAGAMVAALERLSVTHAPSALPEAMQAMGIRGGERTGLRRLLLSHPPIEDRIAALRALGDQPAN